MFQELLDAEDGQYLLVYELFDNVIQSYITEYTTDDRDRLNRILCVVDCLVYLSNLIPTFANLPNELVGSISSYPIYDLMKPALENKERMTYHFDINGRGRPKVRPKTAVTLSQLTKTILSRKKKSKEKEAHLATKEFVPQLNLPAEEAYMSHGRQLRKRPGALGTTSRSHKRSRRSANFEDWSMDHEVIKIEDDDEQPLDADEEDNKDDLFEKQIDNLFEQIVPSPKKKKKTVGKKSRTETKITTRTSGRQTRSSTLHVVEESDESDDLSDTVDETEESDNLSDTVDESEESPEATPQPVPVVKKSRAKPRTVTSKRQTRSSEIQIIDEPEESETLSHIVDRSAKVGKKTRAKPKATPKANV
ncbi:unnamed protein product [Ambrosiozyma monospora]|uniref:Unnamed protein product n=1 Tax=Ambrosiozyma monospora TaxID=43982 RepID=A0ACB5TND3_AMBMO|nr:unnamed protein product [Ambrosiozyma monospora]